MITTRSRETNSSGTLLTILVLAFMGCGPGDKERDVSATAGGYQIVPVEVAVTERKDLAISKIYSGTLEGEEQANIVSKVSERITGINAHVGQAVRPGEVLIGLDKSGASSQYYQAEANFKNAGKTLERMKSLFDEGAISLQVLDGAQTAYDVAKANFEAARNTVELTTPIPGVLTAINVNIGDLAVPGSVLATVAQISRMKVIFSISENDVPGMNLGQKVQVYSEARPDVIVDGKIVQISKSADVRSRSFEVKAMFPNTPDRWFKPGLFCRAQVHLAPRKGTLVIPNGAVQSDGVTSRVFVVRGGRVYARDVRVGETDGHESEILQGLAEHDTVATTGVTTVKDSGFVNVIYPPK